MTFDIAAGLAKLRSAFQDLQAALEWHKLAQQELRPDIPPAFRLPDHATEELKTCYGRFLWLARQISEALASHDTSAAQRFVWQEELAGLVRQVRHWHLEERFISH